LIDDSLKRDRKLIDTLKKTKYGENSFSKLSTLKDSKAIDSFKLPKIVNQSKLSQNEFSLNKILSKDLKSKHERIQTSSNLKEIIFKNSKSSQLDSNLFQNKTLDENNLSFSNKIDKNSAQKLNQSKPILITNILYNDQKNLSETIINSSPISKPLIIRDKLNIVKNFIERKNKSDSALITPSSCFDNIKSSFKSFTNLLKDKGSHSLEPKDLLKMSLNFAKEKIEIDSNSKSNLELIDKKSLSKPAGFSNSENFQVEKIKIIENQVQKEKITKILSIKSLQTLDRNQSNKDMKASVDLLLPNINQIHIKNETIQDKQIRSENQKNNNLLSEIKIKRNKKIKKVKKSKKLDSVEHKNPEINIQKVTSSTELQSTNKTDLNKLINYNERNIKLKTKKIKNQSHLTIMGSETATKSSTSITNDLKKKGRKSKFVTNIGSTNDSDILEKKISEISIQKSSSNMDDINSRERKIKLKIKKSFKQYNNNSDDTNKEIETDSDINEDNNNLKIIIQDEYSSTSINFDSKTSINTETNTKKSNESNDNLDEIHTQNLEINIENQASLDELKPTSSNLNLIRFNSESNLSNSSIMPQSSMTSLMSDFEKIINRNILNENNENAIALKFSKSDKRFIPKRMFKTGFLSELYFTPAYNFSYFDLPLDQLEFNRKHSRLAEYKEIILNIKINEKLQKSSISKNNHKKKLNDIIDKIFSDLKKHKENYKKIQNFKMKPYNAYYLRNHIAEIIGSLEKYDKDYLYGKFFQEIPNINFLNLNNLKLPLL
jgi:hypothetical protein